MPHLQSTFESFFINPVSIFFNKEITIKNVQGFSLTVASH